MTFHYIYDENGRLTSVVRPSGKIVALEFDLSDRGAAVSAKDEKSTDIVIVKGNSVTTTAGELTVLDRRSFQRLFSCRDSNDFLPSGLVPSYCTCVL